MSAQTQIIISAKDMATSTFRQVGLASKSLTNEIFNLRNMMVGGVVGGMAAMARSSIAATDQIGKVADKVGLTTDQLQELRFAADLAGVAQSQLDMGMQRFSRRLGEVAQGQGELLKISEQYGVELRDGQGGMRSNIDLLGEWANVIRDAESEQEALRIAFKLFDSEGAALVNMLRGGSAELRNVRQSAHDLGLVIEERLVRQSEEANNQLTIMQSLIQTRLRSTLAELAPDIIEVANGTFEWVKANREFLTQEIPEKIRKTIDTVKDFKNVVSISADIGALQIGGLGYIGYKLFGAGGPTAILVGLYAARKEAEAFNQVATPLAEQLGLLMPAPEGYDKSVEDFVGLGDLLPGGRVDKVYREFMRRLGGRISGKVEFSTGEYTDYYKNLLEEAKGPAALRSFLMIRPPASAVDPRDRDYYGGRPEPWDEPAARVTPMTDQQLKLQESLSAAIRKLMQDQFAYARSEAEATYQKDLEIAGKQQALVALAGERRRLSLASIAEDEAKFRQEEAVTAAQAQRDLTAEIERYTLDQYEVQRRESKRMYDDLIVQADKAGRDTVALEEAKQQRIAEINIKQLEDQRREREEQVREAERSAKEVEAAHIRMLESSNNMADGVELGMLRIHDSARTTAEGMADLMVGSARATSDAITDMVAEGKFEIDDLFSYIRRQAIKTFFAEPATEFLFSGLRGVASSLFSGGLPGFADGGVSYGPQLAMVSEGRYAAEAHVPLPDGRSIPVTLDGVPGAAGQEQPIIIQLIGQDGRVLQQIASRAQAPTGGGASVTKQEVAVMFMQAVNENTAGLARFLRGGN